MFDKISTRLFEAISTILTYLAYLFLLTKTVIMQRLLFITGT